MFRDSTSGSAHMKRKEVLWFEAATLECKSTCCVLWPLEGSMRAAQCDDSNLSAAVRGCNGEETIRRLDSAFRQTFVMSV